MPCPWTIFRSQGQNSMNMRARWTLWLDCLIVAGVWLLFDLVLRDPWTILFVAIALGSDFLVRNATGGAFVDANAPIGTAARVVVCVALYAGPAVVLRWLSAKLLSETWFVLVTTSWLIFYVGALTVLFPPRLPGLG